VHSPLLDVRDVYFAYRRNEDIIRNATFQIERGEVVGLLGPNGAGKTTLIKLLVGIHAPREGHVRMFGNDPYNAARIRGRFGVVHQEGGFDQMVSGWDNLYISGKFFNLTRTLVRRRVDELSEILGDVSFLSYPPITYSGGQLKRLQILRALLHDPDFLILDEPTTALDVEGRRAFYKALQDLLAERHLTAIWTTHYLEEVEQNCPRTIILKNGGIIQDGSTQELKNASVTNRIEIMLNADDAELLCNRPELQQNLLKKGATTWEYEGSNVAEFYRYILPRLLEAEIVPQSISQQEPKLEEVYLYLLSDKKSPSEDEGNEVEKVEVHP